MFSCATDYRQDKGGEAVKYLICESSNHAHDAGDKARDDIRTILGQQGWGDIAVHRGEDKGLADKLKCVPLTLFDWLHVAFKLKRDDILLVQYPQKMYPQVSLMAIPGLKMLKKKGVKLIYLVHDLESLRGYEHSKPDHSWLACADVVIAHNAVMVQALRNLGLTCPIVNLSIFDYLDDNNIQVDAAQLQGIDIAGNLKPQKAGYVYELKQHYPKAVFNLYGPNFVESSPEKDWYKGSFPPEKLMAKLSGRFGLIWDGNSVESCTGQFGEYLKVNNPHKMSLYLAANKPVLIWNQAAQASFVREHGVGVAVSSLDEAVQLLEHMTDEEYAGYAARAASVGAQLRSGAFTKQAVDLAERYLRGEE